MYANKCMEKGLEKYRTINRDFLWGEQGRGAVERGGERGECAFLSSRLLLCLSVKE